MPRSTVPWDAQGLYDGSPLQTNGHTWEGASGQRWIELWVGDVTRLRSDLLVVSAYTGDYVPSPRTVFATLRDHYGLEARADDLVRLTPEVLLWKTPERLPFGAVLIVEVVRWSERPTTERPSLEIFRRALESLGEALATMRDPVPTSLAMPFLATGLQRFDPHEVIPEQLRFLRALLERTPHLTTARFATLHRTSLERYDAVFQEVFQQPHLPAPALPDDLCEALVRLIEGEMQADRLDAGLRAEMEMLLLLYRRVPEAVHPILTQARRVLEAALAVAERARGLAPSLGTPAMQRIAHLQNHGLSPVWLVSYMHLLRVFGNVGAHAPAAPPAVFTPLDLVAVLASVYRLVQLSGPAGPPRPAPAAPRRFRPRGGPRNPGPR